MIAKSSKKIRYLNSNQQFSLYNSDATILHSPERIFEQVINYNQNYLDRDLEYNNSNFFEEFDRINLAAIDILENLVSPNPSEKDIGHLEHAIRQALKEITK